MNITEIPSSIIIQSIPTEVQHTESTNKVNFEDTLKEAVKSENSTSMDKFFEEASKTYGVAENLLRSVAKAESEFNPKVVSKSGAMGVMQLMPDTAKYLGVTDPFDPKQNIMGGAKYLSELLEKYDGDTKLTLAAYNAGSGNVAKYGGVPPFTETQNYVAKVQRYMKEEFPADNVGIKNNTVTSTKYDYNPNNKYAYNPNQYSYMILGEVATPTKYL